MQQSLILLLLNTHIDIKSGKNNPKSSYSPQNISPNIAIITNISTITINFYYHVEGFEIELSIFIINFVFYIFNLIYLYEIYILNSLLKYCLKNLEIFLQFYIEILDYIFFN